MQKNFSLKKLIKSFLNAFDGFRVVYRQQNFKLMIFLAIAACFLGLFLKINYFEWLILILIIGIILTLEVLNTFFEKLLDILEPNYSKKIKIIKDLGSLAVLMVSLTAIILGILIFGLKLVSVIK